MTKQEMDEYRMYVTNKYDEHLMETEKRGVSWGEVAYIGGLKKRELEALEKELDEEALKKEAEDNAQ